MLAVCSHLHMIYVVYVCTFLRWYRRSSTPTAWHACPIHAWVSDDPFACSLDSLNLPWENVCGWICFYDIIKLRWLMTNSVKMDTELWRMLKLWRCSVIWVSNMRRLEAGKFWSDTFWQYDSFESAMLAVQRKSLEKCGHGSVNGSSDYPDHLHTCVLERIPAMIYVWIPETRTASF